MLKLLESRVAAAEQLKDPAHVRVAALGLFRITLQHACVSLGEWIAAALREQPSRVANYTSVDLAAFAAPADGTLTSLLSQLLVSAENIGWRAVARTYWEQHDLPEELRQLTGLTRANIETVLTAFVRLRNDSGEGHGLAGGYNAATDISVVRALLRGVSGVLPTVTSRSEGVLMLPQVGNTPALKLKTLHLVDGNPLCYRRIRRSTAGRVQVDAQVQVSLLNRKDISYEVENVLLDLPRASTPEYSIAEPTWTDTWRPFVHIPERLAAPDVFTGRAKELNALRAWADDEDSRKCMVWGDGGVGKTTLVVEFLHQLLERNSQVRWRPDLITFYTAKKTRWGLTGLEHISAQDIGVADVSLDIARMLTRPTLDRSWFEKSPREVIQKLATLLGELKISRDSHLLVLDNTETMAQSDADVQALAAQINELSRRVGRVILTSRRREQIEALPIQTENWTDAEGGAFLGKRGAHLKCTSIQQAGDATLRRYSRKLSNKPIALEVFVQAAAGTGIGLDQAFQRVQRMQRQDLGQFLYDDAWARLSPELRRVLLLMSRVGDIHDQYLMQLCCQRTEVSMAAASEAIEESRGIASVSRFEGGLQIAFNPEFFNYCVERTELIDGKATPTNEDVEWVKRRYAEFVASASAQVNDRNARAFRVASARAAWKNFMEDKVGPALEYYEIAALEDSENGWLFDRYAYTLMRLRRFDEALAKAKKAVDLLPEDPEVYFTKGMIESRLHDLDGAIRDLDRAAKLGKPKYLCELQKAYAYVYSEPRQVQEALSCLEAAKRSAPRDNRFTVEATRFERRWASSLQDSGS